MSDDYGTDHTVESRPVGTEGSGYRVALACPMYDDRMWSQTKTGMLMASLSGRHRVSRIDSSSSLLAHTFNSLWVRPLGQQHDNPFTHFCMLHADLAPEPGWIDLLLDEMDRVGADVLSVHSPIKDGRGLTSTGVDVHGSLTSPRRFTLKEVIEELPETFDNAGCGYPDRPLLVNTGCLLVDLRKPWVRKVCFQISNHLVWNIAKSDTTLEELKAHGVAPADAEVPFWLTDRVYVIDREDHVEYTVLVDPEDWDFSRQAHAAGARVFATRKVRMNHFGTGIYSNFNPVGQWARDEEFFDHPPVDCEATSGT